MCDEAVNTTISACEEHQDGKETTISGAILPLEEDKYAEATTENLGRGSVEAKNNQFVEARTERGSLGSKDDGFSSRKDGWKPGTLAEEPLLYVLPYLMLQDILRVESVSKICRERVRDDVSLWQQVHVEHPLSENLTDEALLKLAERSKGQLQCLSLEGCLRITASALEHVVCSSPQLSKLHIPGCWQMSPEAVLKIVKKHSDHRSPGMDGLKQLRLHKINFREEELDMLLIMLGDGKKAQCATHKPLFYHHGYYARSCDDQRPIDIEVCPRCSQVQTVYDCTRDICQKQQGDKPQQCRGCNNCIGRCEECGMCEYDEVFEEGFCACFLCSSCRNRLPKCSECNEPGCSQHHDPSIITFVCYGCFCPSPACHV